MEQTLGKRIAEHRKQLNLTQDQLADRLGITAQAVSKWENDLSCPDIAMLPRLAEIFNISIDELLGREAPQTVHEAEVVREDADLEADISNDNDRVVIHWNSGRRGALIFGLMVLSVGVLMLLNRIYGWEVSFWSILWPCAMIAYGLDRVIKKFSVFDLGVGLFGCYFLVNNLGFIHLAIGNELYFPIIIVLLGLALLVDALRKPRKSGFHITHSKKNHHKGKKEDLFNMDDDSFDCTLSFGERTHLITSSCLRSGSASVSFGELILDLSQVQQVADRCELDISCSFGEVQLLVPRRFRVEAETSTAFASSNIKGHPDPDPAGVIYLDSSVSFGEICVKYI